MYTLPASPVVLRCVIAIKIIVPRSLTVEFDVDGAYLITLRPEGQPPTYAHPPTEFQTTQMLQYNESVVLLECQIGEKNSGDFTETTSARPSPILVG